MTGFANIATRHFVLIKITKWVGIEGQLKNETAEQRGLIGVLRSKYMPCQSV